MTEKDPNIENEQENIQEDITVDAAESNEASNEVEILETNEPLAAETDIDLDIDVDLDTIHEDLKKNTISYDDVEQDQRSRISLTEYSNRQRKNKRVKVALTVLATLLILALIALIVIIVLMFVDSENRNVSTSPQEQTMTLLDDADEKETTMATSEVVRLSNLIGLSQEEAIEEIGHGADVASETLLAGNNPVTEVVVLLTDERGDAINGTPTVILHVDENDAVVWCSYTAPTAVLGYGNVSFSDAIQSAHILQNTLRAAGLSNLDPSVLNLPSDKMQYSTYDSDGTTLMEETITFTGTGEADDTTYHWTATLVYDYTYAISSGNLADTVRTITVGLGESIPEPVAEELPEEAAE